MLEAIADVAYYVPPQVVTNAEIYIDDLQMDVEADSELEAACAFSDMADVFHDMIQVDMCADLAYEKAAVVAAAPGDRRSDRLARAVRRRLGKAGGAEVVAAHNLGIDFAAGRERSSWVGKATSLRTTRMAKWRRRAARASVLKRSLRSKGKAKRLFGGNIRAVAFYGAEVHGLDDRELAGAWRLGAKCLSPSTLGRSVEALALTNLSAIGPLPYVQVRRWASEVWKAACGTDSLAIPLPELSRIFRTIANRGFPDRWRKLRGPVAGAFLALRRIGWSFARHPDGSWNPFGMVTDLGDTLLLTRTSPAGLEVFFGAAYARALERRIAGRWKAVSDLSAACSLIPLAHCVGRVLTQCGTAFGSATTPTLSL
jgi:hypothetical protein